MSTPSAFDRWPQFYFLHSKSSNRNSHHRFYLKMINLIQKPNRDQKKFYFLQESGHFIQYLLPLLFSNFIWLNSTCPLTSSSKLLNFIIGSFPGNLVGSYSCLLYPSWGTRHSSNCMQILHSLGPGHRLFPLPMYSPL